MTDLNIMGVLNDRLGQWLSTTTRVSATDIDYPNRDYSPTLGTSYIKVDIMPAQTSQASIGQDSRSRNIGIYQLMIFVPKNRSMMDSVPIVNELKEYFKFGTGIILGDIKIKITRFQIEPYLEDDAWFVQPVSISYRADLEN